MSFLHVRPDADFEKNYARYERGELGKARAGFEERIKMFPKEFPSYLAIGYTYLDEGKSDLAEKYIRESLQLQPDYPQAHYALANILQSKQDYDGALDEFQIIAQSHPDYPAVQQDLNLVKLKATEMHLTQGRELAETDPDEALRHFKKAQELAPEIGEIPQQIADIYLKQGNCQNAIEYLETAAAHSDDPATKLKWADCLFKQEQYDRALTAYQELAALRPEDAQVKEKIESIKKTLSVRALPEEFQSIQQAAQITRAQFAALLMVRLDFLQTYSSGDSHIIVDAFHHWAQPYIQKTVDLGLIDLFPNRTFQPSLPLSRLELARAGARLLDILNINPPAASEMAIYDVYPGNINYRVISRVVSARLVSSDADGRFRPSRATSGTEAISMVNRILELKGKS